MRKATVYNIADSNIANLGTELEKNVKLEAAKHEEAWQNIGKEVGLQIWRIEQFHVKSVPKQEYGHFYSGDSYIILHTYKPKPNSDALAWDVHFWLGTYTTQDEAGTAAYKTVELDDYLGGAPVQYREVQGYESQRFMSYFPKGIRIQDGGVESGFKHVDPKSYRHRLLHIKGKKHVRVSEMELSHKSLNSGDVFIVDAGEKIVQWNGSKSGIMERAKGAETSQAIVDEREGKTSHSVVDEGSEDAEFWTFIGGKGPVASAAAGGSDAEEEKKHESHLWKLSDASGKFEFSEVAKGEKIHRKLLDSNDVFILDTGVEVYAWVGKSASVGEKKKALSFAQEYVTKQGKPVHTPIIRVLEGGENEVFESYIDGQ